MAIRKRNSSDQGNLNPDNPTLTPGETSASKYERFPRFRALGFSGPNPETRLTGELPGR